MPRISGRLQIAREPVETRAPTTDAFLEPRLVRDDERVALSDVELALNRIGCAVGNTVNPGLEDDIPVHVHMEPREFVHVLSPRHSELVDQRVVRVVQILQAGPRVVNAPLVRRAVLGTLPVKCETPPEEAPSDSRFDELLTISHDADRNQVRRPSRR